MVPVRNGSATIALCIEAILAQSYPKELTEIIVVDHRSADDTGAVAGEYPVMLLRYDDGQTSYGARNYGIANATGEIIALTDCDCAPDRDWLANLVAPFDDPTVGAVAGTVTDAPPNSLCEELTTRVRPFQRPDRRGLKTLLTANAAIRRSTLDELALFDERLPTGGDVDFGWRMQMRTQLRLLDVPEARVAHRHRATFRGVFEQYQRYGRSEVLLTMLYGGGAGSSTAHHQVRRMLSQLRAMCSYVAAFVFRAFVSVVRGFDRRYLLWPLFLLTVEAGNFVGKVSALIATHYYRRNPYQNPRIDRSERAGEA